MKRMLVVMNTMGRAGAEKALVTLLRSLDYTRVSVSLLALIDRGEMFAELPPQVNVLNRNPSPEPVLGMRGTLYIARRVFVQMCRGGHFFRYLPYAVKNAALQLKAGTLRPDKLLWLLIAQTAPPPDTDYDMAIAFLEGGATYYVAERVCARVKLSFNHVNYEKAGYLPALDLRYYEAMDYICCVSESVQRVLAEHAFPSLADRTRLFPNLIDRDEILAAAQSGTGFADDFDGLRLVTVARLHPQKGLDVAIGALARLVAAGYQNLRWYVLGDGTERAGLERLIRKHGLEGRFVLLGSRANPYPFVAQADLYIQPSRFEGLCLSLLEALLLGRPCVTTRFDGLPDLLRDGVDALILDLSEENLALAVARLADDPALRAALCEGTKTSRLEFPNRVPMLYELMDGNDWEESI